MTMTRTIQFLLLTLFWRCLACAEATFITRPSCCSRLVEATATTSTTKLTAFGKNDNVDVDDDDDFSLGAFQKAKDKQKQQQQKQLDIKAMEDFDGYALRDVIFDKWGSYYDVNFNRMDSFRSRQLYLNILPYQLGRKPCRHDTELDYLSHLQAVVEILRKYEQLDYVLEQIRDTKKKPIAGRVSVEAVPIKLDLTKDEVDKIIG
jgi:hypothetical protein